jgi:hypothetical protein
MAIDRKLADQTIGIIHGLYQSDIRNVISVVIYGSLQRDVDLLIVMNAPLVLDPTPLYFKSGNLVVDGIQISQEVLLKKLSFLDIAYTEPLLTGKLLIGDPKWFRKIRCTILKTKPTRRTLLNLLVEGCRCTILADMFLQSYKLEILDYLWHKIRKDPAEILTYTPFISIQEGNSKYLDFPFASRSAELVLLNLAFASSYFFLSDYYKHQFRVITFSQILEMDLAFGEKVRKLHKYRKAVEYGRKIPTLRELIALMEQIKQDFTEAKKRYSAV